MTPVEFDLIVIGGGPAGYKTAIGAARLGAKVAVVERGRTGGTCLNEGCIASKTLLHLASLIEDVRSLTGRGLAGSVTGDFAAAVRHKDAVITSIRDGIPAALKRLGISLVQGEARFEHSGCVIVEPSAVNAGSDKRVSLKGERIVVATGSRPRVLPECPVDGEVVVSSREFLTRIGRLPERLLCIGGGAIGVEAAYLAREFGACVTIVERESRLLPFARVPEHVSDILERKLERLGIEVRTGISPVACRIEAGQARVAFSDGSESAYGLVLVAVGRVPNTEDLGLRTIGVQTTPAGHIPTNEYLETGVRGVYAAGDVRAGPMTANAALHDAKVVVENAIGGKRVRANYFKAPFVVHSALEMATVGLSETQADEAGFTPEVARASFGASGKARARHDYEGFVEVVHDAETGQLLGGCIVGPEAGEQISLMAAACQSSRGLWLFKDLSYSHPSWCEEIETAVDPCTASLARSAGNLFRPGILAQS
jgi:dihydrolipoamide dehydrogenase